jgi:cephalosporin hydroxylase
MRKTRGRTTRVLACLESNLTHERVLAELESVAPSGYLRGIR